MSRHDGRAALPAAIGGKPARLDGCAQRRGRWLDLKLPAGAETRYAAAPPAGDDGAVSEELAFLIRAYTRGAALVPVMHTHTSRRVVWLLDGAGQTLAEIAADHVSAESADGSADCCAP